MKEHHHMRWPDTDPDLYLGRRLPGTGGHYQWSETGSLSGLKKSGSTRLSDCRWGVHAGKRQLWFSKHVRSILFTVGLMGLLFLFDSLVVSFVDSNNHHSSLTPQISSRLEDERGGVSREQQKQPVQLYGRLLNLASASLDEKEFEHDLSKLWVESYKHASLWKPCAERTSSKDKALGAGSSYTSNGFIVVSANGGLNQQRVGICNAVALASLLNATLVLPKFLYSNVWKDPSQFGDIYQEEHFMNILKDDIDIARELPFHLKSLDMETIGSLITDADIAKEAKPIDYLKNVLPILRRNGVVHLLGFGNRLGFDPVTSNLQKLRCKCNFHALKFVPKIQEIGSLLIRRIRKYDGARSKLDKQLLGTFMREITGAGKNPSKYLALHLRFEVDMLAYSLCDFGGGDIEKRELQAYRERHFPLLLQRLKSTKHFDPRELRQLGKCPLTPEEAALVLSGLGVKRGTYIYLAGSQIYGGKSRMHPFTSLYPNLVTKEDLLTPAELAPLTNFSSQTMIYNCLSHVILGCKLAALDFIACATADVFAMTDSGSQLSSLVSGFRTYYGEGHAPTLRPNKKELAAILSENSTISWNTFEERIREMIEQGQKVHFREFGRSIYRQPRCPECMCRSNQ